MWFCCDALSSALCALRYLTASIVDAKFVEPFADFISKALSAAQGGTASGETFR